MEGVSPVNSDESLFGDLCFSSNVVNVMLIPGSFHTLLYLTPSLR